MNSLNSQPSPLEPRPAGEATAAMKNSSTISNSATTSDKAKIQPSMDAFEQSRIAFFSK